MNFSMLRIRRARIATAQTRGTRGPKRRSIQRAAARLTPIVIALIGIVSGSLAGCSTIKQESLTIEAGTHQFPSGETPWVDFDKRLQSEGFLNISSSKFLPGGVPKNLKMPKNAKNPYVYVGLSDDRSFTILAISAPRNFVTVTSHIHAHGGKGERKAYIRGSLNWLKTLVEDIVEANPYGKSEYVAKVDQQLVDYK